MPIAEIKCACVCVRVCSRERCAFCYVTRKTQWQWIFTRYYFLRLHFYLALDKNEIDISTHHSTPVTSKHVHMTRSQTEKWLTQLFEVFTILIQEHFEHQSRGLALKNSKSGFNHFRAYGLYIYASCNCTHSLRHFVNYALKDSYSYLSKIWRNVSCDAMCDPRILSFSLVVKKKFAFEENSASRYWQMSRITNSTCLFLFRNTLK